MKFLVSRIMRNIPIFNKLWLSFLEYVDFKYYDKNCSKYKIVPFGNYCLPRVITTVNRFKPTKKYGEKSFPFDICFSDFASNLKLLSTNFKDFFNNVEYREDTKNYINNEFKLYFNHDHTSFSEFKERYQKRIDNLYNVLHNNQIHIYFVVATLDVIDIKTIEAFIGEINRYRNSDTYDLIVINQAEEKLETNYQNVYIIDLTDDNLFEKLNKKDDWVGQIKRMKSINARIFNYKIKKELLKIIKTN